MPEQPLPVISTICQEEVRLYAHELIDRPSLVIANKMDRVGQTEAALQRLREGCARPVIAVSGLRGDNIPALKLRLRQLSPTDVPL